MKKRIAKNFVLSTGALALMLFAPAAPKSTLGQAISTVTNQIEVQAAQTYSDNWKEDATGNWHFYNDDGTLVKDAWVHDYGEWYLLDSNGTMRTGVFRSNGGKYYVLDTVRGTGTYGKLLKDGMVYQGVVLHADTSATYEGALTDETLQQLANAGVEVINVPNVENTMHVDKDADRGSSIATDNIQTVSSEGAAGGYYNSNGDWVPPEVVTMNFSNVNDHVEIDGIMYGYDTLRKEVRVSKFGSMKSMGSMEHHFR